MYSASSEQSIFSYFSSVRGNKVKIVEIKYFNYDAFPELKSIDRPLYCIIMDSREGIARSENYKTIEKELPEVGKCLMVAKIISPASSERRERERKAEEDRLGKLRIENEKLKIREQKRQLLRQAENFERDNKLKNTFQTIDSRSPDSMIDTLDLDELQKNVGELLNPVKG